MIIAALDTGMRQGEMLAVRFIDGDIRVFPAGALDDRAPVGMNATVERGTCRRTAIAQAGQRS